MKNYFLLSLFAFMAISCSSDEEKASSDSDNAECIKCQEMEVGETFVQDGVTYTVVDDESLRQAVEEGWDMKTVCTSHVTDMSELFHKSFFNGDISKWDVSNVTNMELMFASSPFNGDISNWDVSKVTNMEGMFRGSYFGNHFSGDISKWDVSNVTNMASMFEESGFYGDISEWDVSKVTNMSGMFYLSPFKGDISHWDVSNVVNCEEFFYVYPTDFRKPNFTNCDCGCN